MWSRIASVLAACVPLFCLVASAQEPSLHHRYPLLRGQSVRPEILGNRLTVLCSVSAHSRNFSTPSQDGEPLETLSIQADDGHLRMRYESLVDGRLVLEVTDRRQVRLQSEFAGKRVIYEQAAEGPVRLEVRQPERLETRTASGLWQMLLLEKLAQTELMPLLEQLRPGWRLAEQVRAVERTLVTAGPSSALADREKWRHWLDQLASPDFRVRVLAERKLRDAGVVALSWLERQDTSALDPEQRDHVLTLREDLLPTRADSPELVAAWLVDDKRVWLALLNREDVETRRVAQQQLEALCGRKIAFDPQADVSIRRQQMAKLESRLAR
jgi:hypothetical protein